ncbi:MAG: hypothetical protein P794_08115 [Epsilonproteobacteria bacterium (ex Lamellibrachia satsuma)]|nr:MAG: hypothetical protein P794_08115 [Epsilonproteobacteria bacterium (ex Lamellibrachia satsuma)]
MCKYNQITICPFDLGDWKWRDALQNALKEIFDIEVSYTVEEPIPAYSYSGNREQFAGEPFLEKLFTLRNDPKEIMLGITKEDLYAPGLNFIFGLASPAGICVISLKRLDNRFWGLPKNDELYFKRMLTEAVHEIGHVLGLPHCPDPHCVMHFSNSLADTDEKGYRFCAKCEKKAKESVCR